MNGLVNGAAQVDGQRSYSRPVLQLPARVLLIWAVKSMLVCHMVSCLGVAMDRDIEAFPELLL